MGMNDVLFQHQRILNAPLCGISDYPFRLLCREMGAAITFAEMASAEGVIRGDRGRMNRVDLEEGEPRVIMQLYGSDPRMLGEAARRLQQRGPLAVDLNMGCPVRKVVASGAGSGLLQDVPRAARIFKQMRAALQIPFTIKLRWDWDDASCREGSAALLLARMAEAEGVDAITLHARTHAQGYSGEACWEQIAMLKGAVSIPVIGNGDIREPAGALAMLEQTGCDAVMIGRALIGDPWLLRDALAALRLGRAEARREAPGWDERREMMLRHARLLFERRGRKAFSMFRKHAAAYLRGITGVRAMRDRLVRASSLEELEEILGAGPDPLDPETIAVNTDEHEARLRYRAEIGKRWLHLYQSPGK